MLREPDGLIYDKSVEITPRLTDKPNWWALA